MIPVPSNVRVWLAVGRTDMRRGMNGLALQVQEAMKRDPHAGDLFVFRGASGDLIKILWHDGLGMSLYAKRLEPGRSRARPILFGNPVCGLCQKFIAPHCASSDAVIAYFGRKSPRTFECTF